MKFHILYAFRQSPWGGGNQFLTALRNQLRRQEHYTDILADADCVLFDGYPFESESMLGSLVRYKLMRPQGIVIHRLNGPYFLYRGCAKTIDKRVQIINSLFMDGTVFQSQYSCKTLKKYFILDTRFETVIHNAANPEFFFKKQSPIPQQQKLKLIGSSWSLNPRKGFDVYDYLDKNLDFNRYKMTFVGNSPIQFKNIKHLPPQPNSILGKILREHDIYVAPSRHDPCSNALIEALSCGLPAVAREDGGHPELLRGGGILFSSSEDMIGKINTIADNYTHYQSNIPLFSIASVADRYIDFAAAISDQIRQKHYDQKRITINTLKHLGILTSKIVLSRIFHKLRSHTNFKPEMMNI